MHDLIFSRENKYRFLRHGLFCSSVFFSNFLRIGIQYPASQFWNLLPTFFSYAIHWTSLILFFCYLTVYVFVPEFFFRKKYILFSVAVLALIIFLNGINYLHDYYEANESFSHVSDITHNRLLLETGIIRFLGNPLLVCVLLLSLRSLKNWHQKKEESESLALANTHAELQLLKSQIHPHFLFNTLNNIYSFSLNKTSFAADLVNKLKHTVHYMIAECNHAYVPLKNELNMIANYIELERIRYGSRLSMQVELIQPGGNFQIAPLLMLPFVENCFKHGVSQTINQPNILLKIYVDTNTLHFFLSNTKPSSVKTQDKKNGLGLENVKKRLDLIYPGKHKLQVLNSGENYTVKLEIKLSENDVKNSGADLYSTREIHKN